MTMPTPKIRPPISAPERLPREDSWRAVLTSSSPETTNSCTATTAVEKASSQTASFSPNLPCQNSITAARRQNLERCAKKPNASPVSRPQTASTPGSPKRSIQPVQSMATPFMKICASDHVTPRCGVGLDAAQHLAPW
ncbi:hypothetical protein Y695_04040 [Hydrogenophaga sp. T4]|nr:hypothetical protein Y695_04040 [Hydrogenophaga sp. T4]